MYWHNKMQLPQEDSVNDTMPGQNAFKVPTNAALLYLHKKTI